MKKKFLLLIIALLGSVCAKAQFRQDSEGNTVYHPYLGVIEYQMIDFNEPKYSSSVGFGFMATSFSHWGRFHLGANINAGIATAYLFDAAGITIDLGPSVRFDINRRCFINMPVNATVFLAFAKNYGGIGGCVRIAPSFHAFLNDRFGAYIGPEGRFNSYYTYFGFQAGLSYSF